MLVLSRKVGERILIGDSISVTVVRISGGGVRIGIDAPPELPVIREELSQGTEIKTPEHGAGVSAPHPEDKSLGGNGQLDSNGSLQEIRSNKPR